MTSRLAIACLLSLTSLSLAGCDRMKSILTPATGTSATTAEVCADPTTGPDLSAERAAEAKALAAHGETAKRDRDLLSLSYQGKVIATIKGCDSFYSGTLRLRNPKTGALENYDVFLTVFNRSVVVDHDGTPLLFQGTVLASPDGRYIASGEAHMDYLNADLMLTDWTSATRAQVSFPIACSPKAWSAAGLTTECDRTDPSRFISDAVVTPATDGWVLRETRLNPLPADTGQPDPAHKADRLLTYRSEIVWPEDNRDWIGADEGVYRPIKGAAIPLNLPNSTIALADPQTGKLENHTLMMADDSYSYRLALDNTVAYDLGTSPVASPNGRFITTFDLNIFLLDWTRKVEVVFDDVYCVDGKWLSPTELQAWCLGSDDTVAHYVEARLTKGGNGVWIYKELAPVRKTLEHTWQPYTAKGYVLRKVIGHDGREMLNEIPPSQVIARTSLTPVNHLNT